MKFTIKRRLQFYAVAVFVLLVFIGGTVYLVAKQATRTGDTRFVFVDIKNNMESLRLSQSYFFEVDSKTKAFLNSGTSGNITRFDELMKETMSNISNLKGDEATNETYGDELDRISLLLEDHSNTFKKLVGNARSIGQEDVGMIGDMRKDAHELEELVGGGNLMIDLLNLRRHEKDYLLRSQTGYLRKFQDVAARMKRRTSNQTIKDLLTSYETKFSNVVSLDQKMRNARANLSANNIVEIENIIDPIIDQLEIDGDAAVQSGQIKILIAIIIAVVVSFFSSYFLIKNITGSMSSISKVVTKVSSGNLNVTIDADRDDETGQLLRHIKEMVDKLRDIVSTVVDSSNNIANASMELSKSSQLMSDGASEQASSAEEVSSSMEEMAANIDQNTANSKQTEQIAIGGANNIIESNHLVSKTLDSMKSITQRISIIGEISRQTNLLALNAAVEAARAGEYGKGFAVVAAEIRRLAERSQTAASEIDEESLLGVETAQASGDMLSSIVPEIQKTADLVKDITSASIEQNNGADQINSAVQNLNQIVQQNAAVAEEMAANSQELYSQAELLLQAISFFQIDENQNSNGSARKAAAASFESYAEPAQVEEQSPIMDEAVSEESNASSSDQGGIDIDLSGENDVLDSDFEKY